MKSYSILQDQQKELFSGFIQAVTTIGDELYQNESSEITDQGDKSCNVERILELDFKYFYVLIADSFDARIVLILNEKASERLKEQVKPMLFAICTKLAEQFENWDGELDAFQRLAPPIISEYLDLFYKEQFIFAKPEIFAMIRKESTLSAIENRVINVIYSFAKGKAPFKFGRIFELIHEENRDLVIDAIETLLARNMIVPYIEKDKRLLDLPE